MQGCEAEQASACMGHPANKPQGHNTSETKTLAKDEVESKVGCERACEEREVV